MTGVRQCHDSSSGDTVVSQTPEKSPVETPSPAAQEEELDQDHELDISVPAEDPEKGDEDDAIKKQPSGAPLDRTPSQAAKMGKKKIIVVMTALCLALFLAALDMTIISTALPTIAADFGASESGFSWIASSYLLANAACIPLWGKLSDIWGRKPIILLANIWFLVGSLICALAKNLAMILAGRAIQGVGGGGIIIMANISVTDLFSMRYVNASISSDRSDANVPTGIALCTMVFLVLLGLLLVHWDLSSAVPLPPALLGDGAST